MEQALTDTPSDLVSLGVTDDRIGLWRGKETADRDSADVETLP
jgi:hypothetical protein